MVTYSLQSTGGLEPSKSRFDQSLLTMPFDKFS